MRFSMVEPSNKTWTLIWSAEGCFHLRCLLSGIDENTFDWHLFRHSYFPVWEKLMKNYQLIKWLHSFGSLLRCRCRQARWEIHYDIRSPVHQASPPPKAERLRRTARRRGNQLSDLSQSGHAIHCLLFFCILCVLSFSSHVRVCVSNFSHDIYIYSWRLVSVEVKCAQLGLSKYWCLLWPM